MQPRPDKEAGFLLSLPADTIRGAAEKQNQDSSVGLPDETPEKAG